MNKSKAVLILFSFLTLVFSGCTKVEKKPQDPLWGKQNCATCRMILSEKRYALQRILPTGKVLYYDDVICALKHDHSHEEEGVLYTRPKGSDEWVRADEASFKSGLMTPMGSGFGAVQEDGGMDFEEVKEKLMGDE